MPYSEFTITSVKHRFNINTDENTDLFPNVEEMEISELLKATLEENVPLAVAISTEKARSELIIAPILVELRRVLRKEISLFSGIDFNVNEKEGLSGTCDFIISRSKEQLVLTAPVIMLVEAKNEDLKKGYGQCIAEMIAAKQFNQRNSINFDFIYGVVTIGVIWHFLKLDKNTVYIDFSEYYINQVKKILGILVHISE